MEINWKVLFGFLVSLVSIGIILWNVNLAEVGKELVKANYLWFIPAIVLDLAGTWTRSVRWKALLDNRIPTSRSFWISNAGDLLNNVLPLRLGELSRAYLVSHNSNVTVMRGLSTVLIERLLDVLTVFGMLVLVIPFVPGGGFLVLGGMVLAAIAFIGVAGMFIAAALRTQAMATARFFLKPLPANLGGTLLKQGDEFLLGVSAAGGKRLLAGIFWSIVTWLGLGGASYLMLLSFVPGAQLTVGVFVTCAVALGLSIPSAPSGAGLYEAGAVAGLAVFGVPSNVALAYAITAHLQSFILTGIFGTIGLDREGESFSHLASTAQTMMASARPGDK